VRVGNISYLNQTKLSLHTLCQYQCTTVGRVGNRYVWQGGQTENQGGQTKNFFRRFAPNIIKQMFSHPRLKPCRRPWQKVKVRVAKAERSRTNTYCRSSSRSGVIYIICGSYHVQERIRTTSFRRPTVTADDRNRIGAISRKALRRGVTHTAFDIEEITDSADRKLFTRITQPGHCLYISSSSSKKTSAYCPYHRDPKHYVGIIVVISVTLSHI